MIVVIVICSADPTTVPSILKNRMDGIVAARGDAGYFKALFPPADGVVASYMIFPITDGNGLSKYW